MALMLAVMLTFCLAASVSAAEASGTFADDLAWTLSGGVLTISGSGAMEDYSRAGESPWKIYSDQITAVVIESGITRVGDFAFAALKNLKNASIAASVEQIGDYSFFDCVALESVELNVGLRQIRRGAFENCVSLKSIRLPSSLSSLAFQAFSWCESLTVVSVPASVTTMGDAVFSHCSALRSASVLADIPELPLWTFYGCDALTEVTLSASITGVGQDAFYDCDSLETANYAGSEEDAQVIREEIQKDVSHEPQVISGYVPSDMTQITSTETIQDGDETIITDEKISQSDSSTIRTDKTTIQKDGETDVNLTIEAALSGTEGWAELEEQVNASLTASAGTIQVNVYLQGESVILGTDLDRFTGKSVRLTITTRENVIWNINGMDLYGVELAESYRLTLVVKPVSEPDEAQSAALGSSTGYSLAFGSSINFKHEVQVPVGSYFARRNASLYILEDRAYSKAQTVVVNTNGEAHLYLAHVEADGEYLIGIYQSMWAQDGTIVDDAIIPEEMEHEYPALETYEHVEYVVTGVKSSLGLNITQVTWILFGVMGGCVIVVGAVVYILFKRKLKAGYVPDMSYAEETPAPRQRPRKKKQKK